MHKRFVLNIASRALLIVCFVMLFPLLWAAHDDLYGTEVKAFSMTIFLGLVAVFLLRVCFRVVKADYNKITAKDGLAIVGISWVCLSLFGALPLYFSGVAGSFTNAFFEVVSGYTTTGSSIFSNVEILPRGILFWRSLTQWLGGSGIIVLYIALLPALGSHTFQLYKAEAPGIVVDRVDPRIKETAKNLFIVYILLTFIQVGLMCLGGMPIFDSLCHSFSTISTGGFSTKNASMGYYSPFIQWVVIIFMFLGGTNFVLHLLALKRKPDPYFRDEEFRYYFSATAMFIVLFTAVLWYQHSTAAPLRDAAFQIISITTTTGFISTDYDLWPNSLKFMLVIMMLVGGCGGSTSGGMKIIRHILALKISLRSIRQAALPNAILPIKFNGKAFPDKIVLAVLSFFAIYTILTIVGTLFLCLAEGIDIVSAFSACAASLGNVGPGLNKVGAVQNYGWLSSPGKWMLSCLMLIGRLELYAILILFIPSTWKK